MQAFPPPACLFEGCVDTEKAAASGPGRLTEEKTATNTPESHYSNLPGVVSQSSNGGAEKQREGREWEGREERRGGGGGSKGASERAQDLRTASLTNWRLQGVGGDKKAARPCARALKMAHSNVHSP